MIRQISGNNNETIMQGQMIEPRKIKPDPWFGNAVFYLTGIVLLFLNKVKTRILGYRNPRPFAVSEFQRAVSYDADIVKHWLEILRSYSGNGSGVEGKVVLELGPGADLGVGLILLAHGAKKYNALDVNDLAKWCPAEYYEVLFRQIESNHGGAVDLRWLKGQLDVCAAGRSDRLNYVCDKGFDFGRFKDESIDYVFSQAAFEHFDDMDKTIEQMTRVTRKGGILITEVDLKTHTRWIRDADPLNIYRYGNALYKLFKYPGLPNRLRPVDYRTMLSKYGWKDIKIFPLVILDEEYLVRVQKALSRKFWGANSDMGQLSVMICATRY